MGTTGYGVEFGLEQYDLMAELLRRIKNQAVVSVNDIPDMRRLSHRDTVGAAGQGRREVGEHHPELVPKVV